MLNTYKAGLQVIDGQDIEQINKQLFEYLDNIVALAGGGFHATTPLLKAGLNRVTTVANSGDSVALPAAIANPVFGLTVLMVANTGAQPCNVEPQPADTINAGAAGAAFSVANGKNALFFCPSKGHWYAILTA